jgi:hypothetical protein
VTATWVLGAVGVVATLGGLGATYRAAGPRYAAGCAVAVVGVLLLWLALLLAYASVLDHAPR